MLVLQQHREHAGIGVVVDAKIPGRTGRRRRRRRIGAQRIVVEPQKAAVARCERAREFGRGCLETARDRAEQLEAQRFARARERFEHGPQRRQRRAAIARSSRRAVRRLHRGRRRRPVSSRAGFSSARDRSSPTNSSRCARWRVCRRRAAQKMRACSRALRRSVPATSVTDDLEKSPFDARFVHSLQHRASSSRRRMSITGTCVVCCHVVGV